MNTSNNSQYILIAVTSTDSALSGTFVADIIPMLQSPQIQKGANICSFKHYQISTCNPQYMETLPPCIVGTVKWTPYLALVTKESYESSDNLKGSIFGADITDKISSRSIHATKVNVLDWLFSDRKDAVFPRAKEEPVSQVEIIVVIATNNSVKSHLFRKKLLPKFIVDLTKNPRVRVERYTVNDDNVIAGISKPHIPKDIYNWMAWYPFIGMFTAETFSTNKELKGTVFRGVDDDYWGNEYKVSPDLSLVERYTEKDILQWFHSQLEHNPIFQRERSSPLVHARSRLPRMGSSKKHTGTLPQPPIGTPQNERGSIREVECPRMSPTEIRDSMEDEKITSFFESFMDHALTQMFENGEYSTEGLNLNSLIGRSIIGENLD